MNTDRELLEFAAKAAGYRFFYDGYDEFIKDPCIELDGFPVPWNPLTDDGDALRLAMKLHIKVMPCEDDSCAKIGGNGWVCVGKGNDPYAATRRAIVRVAAEIGRSIP